MSSGEIVYTGPVTEALTYFDQCGFPCQKHVNPADHLIDTTTVDRRTMQTEEQSTERVNALILSWKRRIPTSTDIKEKDHSRTTTPRTRFNTIGVSFLRQVWYLTHRNFWITIRDPLGLGGFVLEAIIIGMAIGWIYYKIPPTLTGIRARQGFIYSVLGFQGYILLLFTIYKASVDMKVPQSQLF